MKKPSDHLFKLIKTLTKSEKRAFRQHALGGKDARKYIAIFDAIDAQQIYNEDLIKVKFKNEKWIQRFNAAKDYVYKALLNDLSVYNQKHEPQYQLTDFLIHIRVLQSKGFYERCEKLIQKAKILAEELGDYLKMLELLNLEGLNHPGGINPKNASGIKRQQAEILKLLDNEFQYNEMYKMSYQIFSRSGYQGFNSKEKKAFDQLMGSPLIKSANGALTFNARRQHININYFYALGNGLDNEMHKWIVKAKELFQSSPKLIKQHAVNYATTLLNLNRSFLKRKEYEQAFQSLNELRTFYPKNQLKRHERLTYIIEYASLHHEIATLNAMGNFKEAESKLADLEQFFVQHEQEISPVVQVRHYYLIAVSCFGVNEFSKCKTYLDRILDETAKESRMDLQKQARLLLLLVFYELEKFDLLVYNVRSTNRNFQRNEELSFLEKKVFKLLQFSLDYFTEKEKVQKTLHEIADLKQANNYVPDYAEIIAWFEAKMSGNTYAETVRLQSL